MSRVTEIRYVGYAVADFETEQRFYRETWGLTEVAARDGLTWFKTPGSAEHHVVRLRKAATNHLDIIGFATPSRADVDALHAKVAGAGCRIVHAPQDLEGPGAGYAFRFFSPDGLPFEISSDVARGDIRIIGRWEGLPLRISHIVLHSPNPQAAAHFFTEVLGFKVSDWLGDFMCFLRCNSAHHRLAFLPGPPCLNHVAYDMTDVDGMMAGISRLRQAGTDLRWGPGRHTAGDNAFSYFVTPAGFAVEYTAGLEEVDFETHVEQVYPPAPRVMDQWGIGVGGPQNLPHAAPDPCLFQPAPV
jgi:catechol 2,3-dioxygenase-like lactoylglutathione lyase family enzyme